MRLPSQRLDRRRDEAVIDADRAGRHRAVGECPALPGYPARTGDFALAHSRRTRSVVSSPLSVVRSMQVSAFSSHAACASFFTVRRPGRRRHPPLDRREIDAHLVSPSRYRAADPDCAECAAGDVDEGCDGGSGYARAALRSTSGERENAPPAGPASTLGKCPDLQMVAMRRPGITEGAR